MTSSPNSGSPKISRTRVSSNAAARSTYAILGRELSTEGRSRHPVSGAKVTELRCRKSHRSLLLLTLSSLLKNGVLPQQRQKVATAPHDLSVSAVDIKANAPRRCSTDVQATCPASGAGNRRLLPYVPGDWNHGLLEKPWLAQTRTNDCSTRVRPHNQTLRP